MDKKYKKPKDKQLSRRKVYGEKNKQEKKKSIQERQFFRAGNMLYPVPAVMVTCMDEAGAANIITVAWTGTVCSDPAMVYISVRKSRHSYAMITKSKEFVINIATKDLVRATDYAGVRSGRDIDKWQELKLTKGISQKVKVPYIAESPISIECELVQVIELGTHDMFLGKVLAVSVDASYIDDRGKFDLSKAEPIVYSHGEYFGLGERLGSFGFSVRKKG